MKYAAFLIAGLLLGGSLYALWQPAPPDAPIVAGGTAGFDPTLPLEARIRDLERAVGEERKARQVLQEELVYLTDELDRLRGDDDLSGGTAALVAEAGPDAAAESRREERRRRRAERNSVESRTARLVEAGLPAERAGWILQRESRYQMAMLELRHEAERNGSFQDYREQAAELAESFRNDLGAADYERYLEGNGRPTSIRVNFVMDSSPAQSAGLQAGDQILRYGGQRVYSMRDLNRLTALGDRGETVYVDIVRDGLPMQVALPRGPVGISGGGRP